MDLMSMELVELSALLKELNQPAFRAKQVFSWLSKGKRPDEMSNLPKPLREELSKLQFGGARIYDKRISKKDGTVKYLFELEDGNIVEGVLMSYHYGNTMCISTQVGCKMGCLFCASTLSGCVRDLTAGEMLSFIAEVEKDVPHAEEKIRTVTNIVLMGSGEPLDNYDNVLKFLRLVSSPDGMNISVRNISISTCGLVDKLLRFTEEAPHVTLSVSLHAPSDEIRDKIMPVNKKYRIDELLKAAKNYADMTKRRVIFEYALIKDMNSDMFCADLLSKRLKHINCHVNLIPLNDVKERNLMGVTRKEAEIFLNRLTQNGVSATIRREMGADIEGACGQLRRSVLENL
ncbi:MAG: 23S rRNA (adenine(2503)-C(2))-methyltransferase RlmN [Clostridia bacterium]|nr:23S rRNA (adenine(2503)-C(2))-methyltransferase RlmN [Clostridia bacterium]